MLVFMLLQLSHFFSPKEHGHTPSARLRIDPGVAATSSRCVVHDATPHGVWKPVAINAFWAFGVQSLFEGSTLIKARLAYMYAY